MIRAFAPDNLLCARLLGAFLTCFTHVPNLTLSRFVRMMRSVCFVDRLEFEFSGNHFPNAITIGDVDNDGVSYNIALKKDRHGLSYLCAGCFDDAVP